MSTCQLSGVGNNNILKQTLTRLITPAFYQLITRTTLALSTVNFSPVNFSPVNCQVSTCHILLQTLRRHTTPLDLLTEPSPPLPNYQLITMTTLALSPVNFSIVKFSRVNMLTFHLSTVNQVTCHIISWHLSSRCQTAS